MTYLLALIVVVAIAILCWKAFGPQGSRRIGSARLRPRGRVLGPDDDPEFLWQISHQRRDGDPGPE